MICFFYFRSLAAPHSLSGANIKTELWFIHCWTGSFLTLLGEAAHLIFSRASLFIIHFVTGSVSFIFTHYHPTYVAPTLKIATALGWVQKRDGLDKSRLLSLLIGKFILPHLVCKPIKVKTSFL